MFLLTPDRFLPFVYKDHWATGDIACFRPCLTSTESWLLTLRRVCWSGGWRPFHSDSDYSSPKSQLKNKSNVNTCLHPQCREHLLACQGRCRQEGRARMGVVHPLLQTTQSMHWGNADLQPQRKDMLAGEGRHFDLQPCTAMDQTCTEGPLDPSGGTAPSHRTE